MKEGGACLLLKEMESVIDQVVDGV
jgi:hypothetical protein